MIITPLLFSFIQAPQTKEELFRKLQEQRAADEETLARKKFEEQRLTVDVQLLFNPQSFLLF